jgi:hypothetical protein
MTTPPDNEEREQAELWASNRRLLAGRQRWPEGALEAVARAEGLFPRYGCYWCGPPAPPGFYGIHRNRESRGPALFGATIEDLLDLLAADHARRLTLPAWEQ